MAAVIRSDGRKFDQLREVRITPGFMAHPSGSCLIEVGNTRVICSAILEKTVPHWLKNSGSGWLTAEYSMLPGSSSQRIPRERSKLGGRTQEIQRLIGRSLRACVDLKALGEKSLLIDCDVLDADGGTRTAAITGSYVALMLAVKKLSGEFPELKNVVKGAVAAVSVGLVEGVPCLDLHYDDDKRAQVDMNIVKTSAGQYVEVQGTAEGLPFGRDGLNDLLDLADKGLQQLFRLQQSVIES
jgi:ribonuclease PH